MSIGLDTGFFVALLEAKKKALDPWKTISESSQKENFVSYISLYELQKSARKGAVEYDKAMVLLDAIPNVTTVVWLDTELLERAARLSHGNGLSMADAIILQSFLDQGCETIYTTDSDLAKYRAGSTIIRL